MAADSQGERFTLISGGAEGVELDSVEPSLADLYHRAAGAEDTTVLPSSRTTLFNLIAYARTEELAREAVGLVGEIVAMLPCRAIVAGPEFTCPAPSPLQAGACPEPSRREGGGEGERVCHLPHPHADISVVCGITERGERRLCGEILLVHAESGYVGGAVTPLLMPDLPVYVWLPGDIPTGDPDFDDVVIEADAAIVDSRQFTDPVEGMARALSFAGPEGQLCAIMDLAWVALLPWREAIAAHFDAATSRRDLDRVSGIIIEYASHGKLTLDCSAALLTSWLVDRLRLRVKEVAAEPLGVRMHAEQAGRNVSVDVLGTACGLKHPGPAAITIRCGEGQDTVSYRTDGIPEANTLPRTIARALDLPKRDHIYESAVQTACELLRLGIRHD